MHGNGSNYYSGSQVLESIFRNLFEHWDRGMRRFGDWSVDAYFFVDQLFLVIKFC